MANTTLISLTQIKESIGQIALRSHGCFGTHNSFNYQDLVDHRNRYASGNCRSVTAEMETIEFFPHINGDAIMSEVAKTVDFFNSIGVYARTFTTSPVNSIMANMRETPADKIFTGECHHRRMWNQLPSANRSSDGKAQRNKPHRRRSPVCLSTCAI